MTLERKARLARLGTFLLLAALLVELTVETLLQPLSLAAMTVVLAVKLAPLGYFLRPVWRGRADSALWLCLLLMPYFCWAILGSFAPGAEGVVALSRALLIGACFAVALLMMRWQRALFFTQSQ